MEFLFVTLDRKMERNRENGVGFWEAKMVKSEETCARREKAEIC
jgi:hypothetical protein